MRENEKVGKFMKESSYFNFVLCFNLYLFFNVRSEGTKMENVQRVPFDVIQVICQTVEKRINQRIVISSAVVFKIFFS